VEDFLSLIQSVSDKALYFKSKSQELSARILELQNEISSLKQELNERSAEIEELKSKRSVENMSQEASIHLEVDMNARIDELVREIDACLLHLKK
jgi:uncharacterized coiled-coil DUF342 family protein